MEWSQALVRRVGSLKGCFDSTFAPSEVFIIDIDKLRVTEVSRWYCKLGKVPAPFPCITVHAPIAHSNSYSLLDYVSLLGGADDDDERSEARHEFLNQCWTSP